MMRRARSVVLAAAAVACGRVLAPAPPAGEPALSHDLMVAGAPIAIAAKAARTLGDLSYSTRRFGRDSTWGYRAADSIHVRIRYVAPSRDSTRVLLEYWGGCDRDCLQQELARFATGLTAEEAPPE